MSYYISVLFYSPFCHHHLYHHQLSHDDNVIIFVKNNHGSVPSQIIIIEVAVFITIIIEVTVLIMININSYYYNDDMSYNSYYNNATIFNIILSNATAKITDNIISTVVVVFRAFQGKVVVLELPYHHSYFSV